MISGERDHRFRREDDRPFRLIVITLATVPKSVITLYLGIRLRGSSRKARRSHFRYTRVACETLLADQCVVKQIAIMDIQT